MTAAYKKEKQIIIQDLKDKIRELEERHLIFGGNRPLRKLNIARKRLELYEISKIQRNIL